ncbi:hypothetical protein Tco_0290097 [Tanacetum coccineum]
MTNVIKGEFEKIKDIKVEDVSLTCDTPFEVFNNEVSRLSEMDDDLFTYEVEVANIPCDSRIDDNSEHEADDDMGFDPFDIRGDDEVELTDEESSDDEDDVAEKDDGYCNGGNLPETYIIGNQLHYQDYEWYEALEDSELKEEALRNKAIMEGFIKDDDDESRPRERKNEIDEYWWRIYKYGDLKVLESCKPQGDCSTHNLAHKRNLENLPSKYQESFSF